MIPPVLIGRGQHLWSVESELFISPRPRERYYLIANHLHTLTGSATDSALPCPPSFDDNELLTYVPCILAYVALLCPILYRTQYSPQVVNPAGPEGLPTVTTVASYVTISS